MVDREARNFLEYIEGRILPRWMSGELGKSFIGIVFGLPADAASEALTQALRAPWLAEDSSPDDALPRAGREVRMPRYPAESVAQYRQRLLEAPVVYRAGGDEETILSQLALAGFGGAVIYDSFNADFSPDNYYSKFLVYLPAGTHAVTAAGPAYGSFSWGDGTAYGPVGITAEQIATIRGIIRKWKSVRWICTEIVFQISGWAYGTGKRWGDPGLTWGGTAARIGAA